MKDLKIPQSYRTGGGSGNPPNWQLDFINRWKDKKARQAALDLFFGNQKMSIYEYCQITLMLEGKKK